LALSSHNGRAIFLESGGTGAGDMLNILKAIEDFDKRFEEVWPLTTTGESIEKFNR
jgi:hypothetical protein